MFYEFGDAAQTDALTRAFRDGLGRVAPDPGQSDEIVAEAKRAFRWHEALFEELAGANGLEGGARA